MSDPREIIQEVSGFYPLFEELLKQYDDLITPAVFGVAWRYCQMKDGVCKASLRKMADILNVSEATVMRRLEVLCNDGYLIDTTPDARNTPHVYADAGRVIMKSHLGVVETVSHRNTTENVQKSVSHRNKTVSQGNATVSGSQLIKESKKDSSIKKIIINSLVAQMFEDAFGTFYGHVEQTRWATLYDSVGPDRASELIKWATKKEIHLENRRSLIDSMETAAKNWREAGKSKQTAAASGDPNKYVDPKWQEFLA
jgi:hypothetical protein